MANMSALGKLTSTKVKIERGVSSVIEEDDEDEVPFSDLVESHETIVLEKTKEVMTKVIEIEEVKIEVKMEESSVSENNNVISNDIFNLPNLSSLILGSEKENEDFEFEKQKPEPKPLIEEDEDKKQKEEQEIQEYVRKKPGPKPLIEDEIPEQTIEKEIEETPVRKKPGPKPLIEEDEEEQEKVIESVKEEIPLVQIEEKEEQDSINAKAADEMFAFYEKYPPKSEFVAQASTSIMEISVELLDFVCCKTMSELIGKHESSIYTRDFCDSLLKDYIDKKILPSSNQLLSCLVDEIIASEWENDYLGEMTIKILKHIKES